MSEILDYKWCNYIFVLLFATCQIKESLKKKKVLNLQLFNKSSHVLDVFIKITCFQVPCTLVKILKNLCT